MLFYILILYTYSVNESFMPTLFQQHTLTSYVVICDPSLSLFVSVSLSRSYFSAGCLYFLNILCRLSSRISFASSIGLPPLIFSFYFFQFCFLFLFIQGSEIHFISAKKVTANLDTQLLFNPLLPLVFLQCDKTLFFSALDFFAMFWCLIAPAFFRNLKLLYIDELLKK